MVHAAALRVGAGEELVEHLVEHDELHEEAGHLGPVERGVDADLPALVVIDAEPDRLASALAGHPPPADARLDAALEVPVVHRIEQLLEIEAPPARVELCPAA